MNSASTIRTPLGKIQPNIKTDATTTAGPVKPVIMQQKSATTTTTTATTTTNATSNDNTTESNTVSVYKDSNTTTSAPPTTKTNTFKTPKPFLNRRQHRSGNAYVSPSDSMTMMSPATQALWGNNAKIMAPTLLMNQFVDDDEANKGSKRDAEESVEGAPKAKRQRR